MDFPIKTGDFPSFFVCLPEGIPNLPFQATSWRESKVPFSMTTSMLPSGNSKDEAFIQRQDLKTNVLTCCVYMINLHHGLYIVYCFSASHTYIYIIISNIIDIIAYGLLYSNHIPSTSRHINGISSPNFLWRPESFPLAGYEWLLLGYTVNSSYNEWTIYMYVINSIWSMKYNMTQLKGYVLNMICVQYTYI